MKVLVIGAGGREHALVWALRKSPRVTDIVCAPGNGGIASVARCIPASPKDLNDLLRVVAEEAPNLTIVGPELPLSLGFRRRTPSPRPRGLWTHPRRRDARNQQRLRQALHAAPQDPNGSATPSAPPAKKRWTRSISSICLSSSRPTDWLSGKGVLVCESKREAEDAIAGSVQRQAAGERGNVAGGRGISSRRRGFLPLVERRQACRAAGSRAGPQATGRRRYRAEHRRHGRLFDRLHPRCSRCASGLCITLPSPPSMEWLPKTRPS